MAEKKYLSGRFTYKTDIGKVRLTNEDRALARVNARGNILLIVCDGMGGQNKGDLASSLAIQTVSEAFDKKSRFLNKYDSLHWVNKTVKKANAIINDEARKNQRYEGNFIETQREAGSHQPHRVGTGGRTHQDGPVGEKRMGSAVEVSPDADAQAGGRSD